MYVKAVKQRSKAEDSKTVRDSGRDWDKDIGINKQRQK